MKDGDRWMMSSVPCCTGIYEPLLPQIQWGECSQRIYPKSVGPAGSDMDRERAVDTILKVIFSCVIEPSNEQALHMGSSHSNRTSWVALGEMKHGSMDNPWTIHSIFGKTIFIGNVPVMIQVVDRLRIAAKELVVYVTPGFLDVFIQKGPEIALKMPKQYRTDMTMSWICHGHGYVLGIVVRYPSRYPDVLHIVGPGCAKLHRQVAAPDTWLCANHRGVAIMFGSKGWGKMWKQSVHPSWTNLLATRDSCHWLSPICRTHGTIGQLKTPQPSASFGHICQSTYPCHGGNKAVSHQPQEGKAGGYTPL